MYFGLGTQREYTLEEIAMQFDLSRERVRNIRDHALKHMRANPNSGLFQIYKNV